MEIFFDKMGVQILSFVKLLYRGATLWEIYIILLVKYWLLQFVSLFALSLSSLFALCLSILFSVCSLLCLSSLSDLCKHCYMLYETFKLPSGYRQEVT